jgi:hypothetical protein
VDAVEADQGVEVNDAAALHLGGFAVREPDGWDAADAFAVGADLDERDAAGATQFGEGTFGGLFGAVPQFGGEQVEHGVVVVVVAVEAQRPAEDRVCGVVAGPTNRRLSVPAGAGVVAAGVTRVGAAIAAFPVGARVLGNAAGVYRAEAGGGEGDEHGRVAGDGVGDAFAADEAGA